MTRKLGCLLLVMFAGIGAFASVNPGSISGEVRNSSGVPQMGAAVEIATSFSAQGLVLYTDAKGKYRASGLLPGAYSVKVSAPSFLPVLREKVTLQSGAAMVVNITLNTLLEAIQMVPRRSSRPEDQDDWRWTLRSMANRPILRLADDGPLVVVRDSDAPHDGVLKAKVAFMAGSDGQAFSGSDMSTQFQYEQSLFSNGTLGLGGTLGYEEGTPAMFRASYSHQLGNGSRPEVTFTAKRFASPELVARHAALQAMAAAVSDSTSIGHLDANWGGEIQSVQFVGHATAFRPFGSADFHLGANDVVEYRFSSSIPNMRRSKGFDSAPADLSESGPRVTLMGGSPLIERARHQEVNFSHRQGNNNMQVGIYRDQVRNTALMGVGNNQDIANDIVPDVYSGTFLVPGGQFSTSGVRAVYQRKLFGDTSATMDYSYGGVLTAPEGSLTMNDVRAGLRPEKRHSVAAKLQGTVPGSKTSILASYRWTQGNSAFTPVDMFNASAGQTDAYMNIFVRQPLPRRLIPIKVEALVDLRNLLAQGYRPVMSADGSAVYLVQVARSVRGGLSFTF
jgi:hypothetical protein